MRSDSLDRNSRLDLSQQADAGDQKHAQRSVSEQSTSTSAGSHPLFDRLPARKKSPPSLPSSDSNSNKSGLFDVPIATGKRKEVSSPAFAKSVGNGPSPNKVDHAALREGFQRWQDASRPEIKAVKPITGGESIDVRVQPQPGKSGVYQVLNGKGARMPFTVTRSADKQWIIAPEMRAAADDNQNWSMSGNHGDWNQGYNWNGQYPLTPGNPYADEHYPDLYATPRPSTPDWLNNRQPDPQAAGSRTASVSHEPALANTLRPVDFDDRRTTGEWGGDATPQLGTPSFLNAPQSSFQSTQRMTGAHEEASRAKGKEKSTQNNSLIRRSAINMTAARKRARQDDFDNMVYDNYSQLVDGVSLESMAMAKKWVEKHPGKEKTHGVDFSNGQYKSHISIKGKTTLIASISPRGDVTKEMALTVMLATLYDKQAEINPTLEQNYVRLAPALKERAESLWRVHEQSSQLATHGTKTRSAVQLGITRVELKSGSVSFKVLGDDGKYFKAYTAKQNDNPDENATQVEYARTLAIAARIEHLDGQQATPSN